MTIALAIAATACGGDDDTGSNDATVDDDAEQEVETPPLPPSDDSDESADPNQPSNGDPGSDGGSATAVPIARFAAHGPQAANTIGPACATGVDNSGGDVFRFTPPASWTWKGTSGGSSYDEVTLNAGDAVMRVTESAYDYDTEVLREFQIIGPTGTEIEIDGEAIPIIEVSLDGAPGYAIVDLVYLAPLPALENGAVGTVVVTSDAPGRPTLDEATELLATVRVERCAAVGEAMIWGPGGNARLVPRFEPDPLGKTYPDQPQPVYEAAVSALDSYTLEQVAYLMPLEAEIAACAAPKAVEFGVGNPVGYLFMFLPSGTNNEALDAIVAEC